MNISSLEVDEGVDAAFFQGDGSRMLFGTVYLNALSADPADPQTENAVIWLSDGTGSGDAGDLMIKINSGSTVKTGTIIDYSTL